MSLISEAISDAAMITFSHAHTVLNAATSRAQRLSHGFA